MTTSTYQEALLRDFGASVSAGLIQKAGYEFKFGHNISVGTTLETLWNAGGRYSYLETATQLTISSDDANDTLLGTGLRTVSIAGLDADWLPQSEIVNMNGQAGTLTAGSYIRVFRMVSQTAGSSGGNEGQVYAGTGALTAGVPANIYAQINALDNQTLLGVYTIAANRTGYLFTNEFSSFGNANAFATVKLLVRPFGSVFQTKDERLVTRGSVDVIRKYPLELEGKTDIEMAARASSGTIDVTGTFQILEIDKT